jgi:pterin-4a-carbinolamine dehydratase
VPSKNLVLSLKSLDVDPITKQDINLAREIENSLANSSSNNNKGMISFNVL